MKSAPLQFSRLALPCHQQALLGGVSARQAYGTMRSANTSTDVTHVRPPKALRARFAAADLLYPFAQGVSGFRFTSDCSSLRAASEMMSITMDTKVPVHPR